VLPPEEWPRLAGTEAEMLWPYFNPDNTRVIVVEDDGVIVGTWTLLTVIHAECLWIAPSHRGIFGVTKRLLAMMRRITEEWKASAVWTGSLSPHVTDLIKRLGGVPAPFESFILPVQVPKNRVESVVGG
jgi:isopentenyldiphosphate isomerase